MNPEELQGQTNEDVSNEPITSGEEDLIAAIRSLNADTDEGDTTNDEPDNTTTDEDNVDDSDDSDDVDNADDEDNTDEDSDEVKGQKRTQSAEENKRFAAERRQREEQAKIQAELDKFKSESADMKLAKRLSEMYGGIEPTELLKQLEEAELQKEAEAKQLPVELLRERRADQGRIAELEAQIQQINFQNWQNRIQSESKVLADRFPMLDAADMDLATDFMLRTAQDVNMPLEQAVYAVHGQKIIEALSNNKVQEKLAADSGRRKKTPVPPTNGKPSGEGKTLTADELAVAKAFGMSADDYLKYK